MISLIGTGLTLLLLAGKGPVSDLADFLQKAYACPELTEQEQAMVEVMKKRTILNSFCIGIGSRQKNIYRDDFIAIQLFHFSLEEFCKNCNFTEEECALLVAHPHLRGMLSVERLKAASVGFDLTTEIIENKILKISQKNLFFTCLDKGVKRVYFLILDAFDTYPEQSEKAQQAIRRMIFDEFFKPMLEKKTV